MLDPFTLLPMSKGEERKAARDRELDELARKRDAERYARTVRTIDDDGERRAAIGEYLDRGYRIDSEGLASRPDGKEVRIRPWGEREREWLADENSGIPVGSRSAQVCATTQAERQTEIDRWVDKGAEIDDNGCVFLNGEPVSKVSPWGAFERSWYRMSKNSV